jgi:transcriptional regulator with XRE-family HTH domain
MTIGGMAKPKNDEEYSDRVREDGTVNATLGKNLRKARAVARTPSGEPVTFAGLAKGTTLHHGSLRRFEKGESGMTVATLARLREALGCRWDDLLRGCENGGVRSRKAYIRN